LTKVSKQRLVKQSLKKIDPAPADQSSFFKEENNDSG
jgi:hypothetical protein